MADTNATNVEITQEEIQKALDILNGIGSTYTTEDTIEKGKKAAEGTAAHEDAESKKKESEEEAEKKMSEKKEAFQKAYGELKGIKKGFKETYKAKKDELKKGFPEDWAAKKTEKKAKGEKKSEKTDDNKHDEPIIKKAVESDLNIQSNDLIKGFTEQLQASTTLIKSLRSDNELIKKSLEEIGSQSNGRKSFSKVNAIEKSFQDEINKGVKILSVSQNKAQIDSTLMDLSNIEKGEANDFYVNAALLFNTAGRIEQSTLTDLYTQHKIKIVD